VSPVVIDDDRDVVFLKRVWLRIAWLVLRIWPIDGTQAGRRVNKGMKKKKQKEKQKRLWL
jgi:hypothetical protein